MVSSAVPENRRCGCAVTRDSRRPPEQPRSSWSLRQTAPRWSPTTLGAWPPSPSRPRRRACVGEPGAIPSPVALLARLGVSIHHERRGLGAALLRDVIARTPAVGTADPLPWVIGPRRGTLLTLVGTLIATQYGKYGSFDQAGSCSFKPIRSQSIVLGSIATTLRGLRYLINCFFRK